MGAKERGSKIRIKPDDKPTYSSWLTYRSAVMLQSEDKERKQVCTGFSWPNVI